MIPPPVTLRPAAALLLLRRGAAGLELALGRRRAGLRTRAQVWSPPSLRLEEGQPAPAAAERAAGEQLGLTPAGPLLACGRWRELPYGPVREELELFLAAGPAEEPRVGATELDQAAWWSPAALLARWSQDAARLEPLTLAALRALAALPPDAPPERAREALLAVAPPEDGPPLQELHPGLRLIPLRTPTLPPATHTNCFVVGAGEELVVIDPASPWEDEQERLLALLEGLARGGQRVREVVLTHHHPDHVGGAVALAQALGVGIAAHRRTRELLEGRVAVTRELEDGERLPLPGSPDRSLVALLTEGHADGHLVFQEPGTGGVIAGDMVAGTGTIVLDPPEGDLTRYLGSLALLRALSPSLLYPSHGPAIGDPDGLLELYVAHRGMRERKVQRALELAGGPAPVEDLVPLAYDDTSPSLYPLAARSLLAHLLHLEGRGLARRRGETWEATPAGQA